MLEINDLLPILDIVDKQRLEELEAGDAVEYLMNKYNCERSDAVILITGYATDRMNALLDDPVAQDWLNKEMPE